eukprot:scpid92127/ scgid33320/ 
MEMATKDAQSGHNATDCRQYDGKTLHYDGAPLPSAQGVVSRSRNGDEAKVDATGFSTASPKSAESGSLVSSLSSSGSSYGSASLSACFMTPEFQQRRSPLPRRNAKKWKPGS